MEQLSEQDRFRDGNLSRIREFGSIMLGAAKLVVEDTAAKVDEWLCDYGDY